MLSYRNYSFQVKNGIISREGGNADSLFHCGMEEGRYISSCSLGEWGGPLDGKPSGGMVELGAVQLWVEVHLVFGAVVGRSQWFLQLRCLAFVRDSWTASRYYSTSNALVRRARLWE